LILTNLLRSIANLFTSDEFAGLGASDEATRVAIPRHIRIRLAITMMFQVLGRH
jgi:hypothetical protein